MRLLLRQKARGGTVCRSPARIAAQGTPQTLDDLERHDCIRRVAQDGDCVASWWFARPGTGTSFHRPVSGTMTFNNSNAHVETAQADAGLLQLHTYMAEPHLKSGALTQVFGDYTVDGPPISVLFPSAKQLSPKVRALIEFGSKALAN